MDLPAGSLNPMMLNFLSLLDKNTEGLTSHYIRYKGYPLISPSDVMLGWLKTKSTRGK